MIWIIVGIVAFPLIVIGAFWWGYFKGRSDESEEWQFLADLTLCPTARELAEWGADEHWKARN